LNWRKDEIVTSRDKVLNLIVEVKKLRVADAPDEVVAEYVARAVHSGPEAVDKNGLPYINHPRRVSNIVAALFTEHSQLEADAFVTAWLHDVIEDSEKHFGAQVTAGDLFVMFFKNEVIEAVELLSKRENQDESEYLANISKNEIARIVKFADLTDNTSPLRNSGLNDERRAKYSRYWNQLVLDKAQ
jgi:(p)ppGpp synthase/HD superfamily hydrolase